MSILLDTSVFVASMILDHSHYDPSYRLAQEIITSKKKAFVPTHTLAEFYATLTAYPTTPSFNPNTVVELIQKNILSHFETVPLATGDYLKAIQRVKEFKLRSGAIYDALLVEAALKCKARILYTWNVEDFRRLTHPSEIQIKTP